MVCAAAGVRHDECRGGGVPASYIDMLELDDPSIGKSIYNGTPDYKAMIPRLQAALIDARYKP